MGLDQYITRGKRIRCPHCGEISNIEWNNEEECYWRKNWDLHHFINSDIHAYGNNEYGTEVELSVEDLEKIKKFELENDKSFPQQEILEYLIDYLKESDDNIVGYSADW